MNFFIECNEMLYIAPFQMKSVSLLPGRLSVLINQIVNKNINQRQTLENYVKTRRGKNHITERDFTKSKKLQGVLNTLLQV